GRVEVFNLRADVEEKKGKWKEALRDRERAAELDPRDVTTTDSLGELYLALRWYSNAERLIDHSIAITSQQAADYDFSWREKSLIALARGDTRAAMAALDSNPFRNRGVWGVNHLIARVFVLERDYAKAEEILQSVDEIARAGNLLVRTADPGYDAYRHGVALEKLGRIARFRGEKEKARGYFEAARQKFEGWLATKDAALGRKDDASWRGSHSQAYIAEIDAALGGKDDAIREGRRAVELWPLKRDAGLAPDVATYLAIVYMWSGERDAALHQLAEVVKLPASSLIPASSSPFPVSPGLSAGELKLDPLWDELRHDPRFAKIIAQ